MGNNEKCMEFRKNNVCDRISHYEELVCVIAVLREHSNCRKPLTVKQICERCMLPMMTEKKVRACLREYQALQEGCKRDMFRYHNGGTMKTFSGKRKRYYYWESILSEQERELCKRILQKEAGGWRLL